MSEVERVTQILSSMNDAWLDGRPEDLAPFLDEAIVVVLPGFSSAVTGKTDVLAGFADFCQNARVLHFEESAQRVDVVGHTAVASFAFDMTYEREGETYRSRGRDLWIFEAAAGAWLAVWRTLLDVIEVPMPNG
jgi:Domain of unknown function (DUF4440)